MRGWRIKGEEKLFTAYLLNLLTFILCLVMTYNFHMIFSLLSSTHTK